MQSHRATTILVQDPLKKPLVLRVFSSIALTFSLAAAAALVRVLPLALAASADLRTAWPFAFSLLLFALEIAVLFGVPIGVALGVRTLVERGETRVYASLGYGPYALLRRLRGPALSALLALMMISYFGGKQVEAPGKVLMQLVAESERACASADVRAAVPVPLLQAAWLCGPGQARMLVGRAPFGGVRYAAGTLRLSQDLRTLDLEDATFLMPFAKVSAKAVTLRGLPAILGASRVPPWSRALAFALAALVSAALTFKRLLEEPVRDRVRPLALAAVGPTVCLGGARWLDGLPGMGGWMGFLMLLVPLCSAMAVWIAGRLLWRLPGLRAPVKH